MKQTKQTKMKTYLNNLITEKGLDFETEIEINGQSGWNLIPLGVVVEHILISTPAQQKQIRNTLVKIDFLNGDVMHFFTYLAKALVLHQNPNQL